MNDNRDEVYRAVAEHRLYDAIGHCRAMVGAYGAGYTPKLDELEELYRTLLTYFARGVPDDRRQQTLCYLSENILQIADDILREQLTHDSGALYYGRLRYRMGFSVPSVAETLASMKEAEDGSDRKRYDELVGQLFDILWTATELTAEDVSHLNASSFYVQSVAISAIGMALQERWHLSFVRYIASILARSRGEVSDSSIARAAVGLLLAIDAFPVRARLAATEIRLILDAAAEIRPIGKLLQLVLHRLCSALSTETLTRRMQTEIIPDLQSLGPEMKKLRSMEDLNELMEGKANPDWIRHIEASGVGEKLRVFGELQEQGADVMHATFMNLKGDYFFRDIHNWFLPFDTTQSRVAGIFAESPQLIQVAEALNTQLCDSDCYSLILSIEMMPAHIRVQALSSMGVNIDAINEQGKDLKQAIQTQQAESHFYIEVKNYIESLYRFYHIYRFRSDFRKIFSDPPASTLPVLDTYMTDPSAQMRVADILRAQGRYADAASRLELLATNPVADTVLYEKLGYAYSQAKRYDEALQMYRRADILTQGLSSLWALKQIAACLRRLRRVQEAHDTYLRCIELKPDEHNLILSAASCLMELQKYSEARVLYKRYERETGHRTPRLLRPLAWCYFLERMFDKAQELYATLVSRDQALPSDYLNAGHTALAQNKVDEAVALYRLAANVSESGVSFVLDGFKMDAVALASVGVDSTDKELILDVLRLHSDSQL